MENNENQEPRGMFGKLVNFIKNKGRDEKTRISFQFETIFILCALISLVCAFLNLSIKEYYSMCFDFLFVLFNIINLILETQFQLLKTVKISFAIEAFIYGFFLIINGAPAGFAPLWVVLLPLCLIVLYKARTGAIISGIMLAIIILLMWTPIGDGIIQYQYSKVFLHRFPYFYLVSFILALFFSLVKRFIEDELNTSKDKYVKLSLTDFMTGVGTNTAYLQRIEELDQLIAVEQAKFAVVFIDCNCIKYSNDIYGHRHGSQLIIETAKRLTNIFKKDECYRIGGDEFCIIVTSDDYDRIEELMEQLEEQLSYSTYEFENTFLTLSAASGYAVLNEEDERYNSVFQRADKAMYRKKKMLKIKYNISER